MNWVLRFPDALVPKTWRSMTYATKFFEWMEYTEDLTIGQCEGNNGKIYEGLVLGVAKRGRRQGMALPVIEFQDQGYKLENVEKVENLIKDRGKSGKSILRAFARTRAKKKL